MNRINITPKGITKLSFVYDNGRPYTAAGIKRVEFNDSDIAEKGCITYLQHDGSVSVVYRGDLAAVTAHYGDNAVTTQKLLDCAVVDGGAHIKARQTKGISPLTAKERATHRAKKIESSIKRYTQRMKKTKRARAK